MAITGITRDQYRQFLEKGGTVSVEIDAEDVSKDPSFEQSPLIKPYLTTGFELRPSPVIHDPKVAAEIYLYGDDWTIVIATVYRNGGSIIYKKLSNGRFQATMTMKK